MQMNTVQYHIITNGTVPNGIYLTIPNSTIPNYTVPCRTKQYHTTINGAMLYQTILYHNKLNSTIPRQVSSNGVSDLLNVSESSLFLAGCASQCQIVTWLRLVARQPEGFPRTQFFLARSGKIVDC